MALDHVALFVDESFRQCNLNCIDTTNPRTEQIDLALSREDVPAFIELTNNLPSRDLDLDEELDDICRLMFSWDSGKCASAVLDGKTKLTKLPFAKITKLPLAISRLSGVINFPLHYAASDSAFHIAALLLQRGFSADIRGDYGEQFRKFLPVHDCGDDEQFGNVISRHDYEAFVQFRNVLPLHVSLAQLRFRLFVLPPHDEQLSAIMFVIKLCGLSLRGSLETLRLIAQNTTELKREFFNYLKEGKMFEVGALLLVAKSKILSPSTAKGEGEFRSISEMHDFVLNTKCLLSNPFGLIKNIKLVEMEETLVLLKIVDKIGDKLAALLRHDFTPPSVGLFSPLLAKSLIEDAGFDVKHIYYEHDYTRSQVVSYFLKRAIDECTAIDEREKRIRTSDIMPSWVKEGALRGLHDKSGSTSHLIFPFPSELPYVNNNPMPANMIASASASPPMPANMMPLHHFLRKTAPFLGTIKKMFRRR